MRGTRTYKLAVSDAGFDLLVAGHLRVIQETRTLVAYGTTVHVALQVLSTRGDTMSAPDKDRIDAWLGRETLFVGAPTSMGGLAARVRQRLGVRAPDGAQLRLSHIYLWALHDIALARSSELQTAFAEVVATRRAAR